MKSNKQPHKKIEQNVSFNDRYRPICKFLDTQINWDLIFLIKIKW